MASNLLAACLDLWCPSLNWCLDLATSTVDPISREEKPRLGTDWPDGESGHVFTGMFILPSSGV